MKDFEIVKMQIISLLTQITKEVFNIISIILLHCATVPTLLALITGVIDKTTSVDVFVLIFAGLFVMMLRSIAHKEVFSTLVNCTGFFIQLVLMALVVFK